MLTKLHQLLDCLFEPLERIQLDKARRCATPDARFATLYAPAYLRRDARIRTDRR